MPKRRKPHVALTILVAASLSLLTGLAAHGASSSSSSKKAAPAEDIDAPAKPSKAAPAVKGSAAKGSSAATAKPAAGGASSAAASAVAAKRMALANADNVQSAGDRVLWDNWYTVTVNKVVHYEYYNDRAEIKKGRLMFMNHAWKQEEDYLNEEQLGVFAKNDADLTPLFFNFHSTYRSVETSIDGNVRDGKELVVRVRKGSTELPLIKKMVPSKTIFSTHFPVWLGARLSAFKPGQVYSFQTILEDNLEAEFATMNGQIRVEPLDETAKQTNTVKVTVSYREMKSIWWLEPNGTPVRIELPLQKTVVRAVTKEAALKFLDEGG